MNQHGKSPCIGMKASTKEPKSTRSGTVLWRKSALHAGKGVQGAGKAYVGQHLGQGVDEVFLRVAHIGIALSVGLYLGIAAAKACNAGKGQKLAQFEIQGLAGIGVAKAPGRKVVHHNIPLIWCSVCVHDIYALAEDAFLGCKAIRKAALFCHSACALEGEGHATGLKGAVEVAQGLGCLQKAGVRGALVDGLAHDKGGNVLTKG